MPETPPEFTTLIYLLAGILLGGLLVGVAWKIRTTAKSQERDALQQENEKLRSQSESDGKQLAALNERVQQLPELEAALQQANQQREAAQRELAGLKARLESEQKAAQEKEKFLENAKTELHTQFENLATKIFEDKSGKFVQKNEEQLSGLLNPLRERMKEFQEKVEQVHAVDLRERSSLQTELKQLLELNQTLSKDARDLTSALKGDSKQQGDWGEFVLETFLQNAGLRKNVNYFVQEHSVSEEGERRRPDIVVKLPNDSSIVIDCKVSLTAYERYASAENEATREEAASAHVQSVRRHLASLSSKNYQGLYKEQGDLDFVLLFMPIEPALLLALSKDEKLFTEAYNKNILLVNPSTLLLALRIVANLWRQEMQAQNVRDIADRGAKLYDKFRGFVEDLQKVGERLRQADESYQGALGKLSTGSGNLIHQAELLRDLGVKPKKTLPAGLVEAQNEEPQKSTS